MSKKRKLTQKQETFCLKYFELGNASEAALVAGYSPRTVRNIASINLTKANIQARIQELRKVTEDKSIASVVERKQVLTEIIRGRVTQFTKGNRINATITDLNSASIGELVTSELRIGKGEDDAIVEITKLKLRDPVSAITELNKMDKLYSEGNQGSNEPPRVQINAIIITGNDVAAALLELAKVNAIPEVGGNGHAEMESLYPPQADSETTCLPPPQ